MSMRWRWFSTAAFLALTSQPRAEVACASNDEDLANCVEDKDMSALLQVGTISALKRSASRRTVDGKVEGQPTVRMDASAAEVEMESEGVSRMSMLGVDTTFAQPAPMLVGSSRSWVTRFNNMNITWLELGVALVEFTLAMTLLSVSATVFVASMKRKREEEDLLHLGCTPVKEPVNNKDEWVLGKPQPPQPALRLQTVGASFVIPSTKLGCDGDLLEFEIAVQPAVWPLRAKLSRSQSTGLWEHLEITVDIVTDAGLPPLLTVEPARGSVAKRAEAGVAEGTGGTKATFGDGSTGGDASVVEADAVQHTLELRDNTGEVVATISAPSDDDECEVQRSGKFAWIVKAHSKCCAKRGGDYLWYSVSRRGTDIALATKMGQASVGSEEEEYVQVDTQPDSASPEAVLLLGCVLGRLAFHCRDEAQQRVACNVV